MLFCLVPCILLSHKSLSYEFSLASGLKNQWKMLIYGLPTVRFTWEITRKHMMCVRYLSSFMFILCLTAS